LGTAACSLGIIPAAAAGTRTPSAVGSPPLKYIASLISYHFSYTFRGLLHAEVGVPSYYAYLWNSRIIVILQELKIYAITLAKPYEKHETFD
jgi:hypothetical protein